MKCVILNYETGEVDIIYIRSLNCSVDEYLESIGYNMSNCHYMCSENLTIRTIQ